MDKATLVLTNVYASENGIPGSMVISSVQGIFSTEEKAKKVWNETLEKFGIENVKAFQPIKNLFVQGVTNRYIPLNIYGQYTPDANKSEYIVEMCIKTCEIDKVLQPGD